MQPNLQHPSPNTLDQQGSQETVQGSVCKAGSRVKQEHKEADNNEEAVGDYYTKLMEALATPAWDGYAEPDESDENSSPKDKQRKKHKEEKKEKSEKKVKQRDRSKKRIRSRSRKGKKKTRSRSLDVNSIPGKELAATNAVSTRICRALKKKMFQVCVCVGDWEGPLGEQKCFS